MLLSWEDYAARWSRRHGGADPRVRGWLRPIYRLSRLLARMGVRPAAVTLAALALCAAVPWTARPGTAAPLAGAGLVALAGLADPVADSIALLTGRVTRLGYVYDAVAHRLGEVAWLVALWRLGTPAWLAVLAGAVTWLHEYLRAEAVAAGLRYLPAVRLAGRPSRVLIAAAGLALAGLAGLASRPLAAGTATFAGAAWLLFGVLGLGQLAVAVRLAVGHRTG